MSKSLYLYQLKPLASIEIPITLPSIVKGNSRKTTLIIIGVIIPAEAPWKILANIIVSGLGLIPPSIEPRIYRLIEPNIKVRAPKLLVPQAVSYTHLTLPTNREV